MKNERILIAMQFKGWLTWGRQTAGILLGLSLAFYNLSRYVSFAAAVGEPVNAAEGFILLGSTPHYINCLLLGALVLLSDIPFLTDRSRYEILRMGREAWIRGQLAYIAAAVLCYMALMAAGSALMLAVLVSGCFMGGYSRPMEMLALTGSGYALREFQLFFTAPALVRGLSPWAAFLTTWLLNSEYFILIFSAVFFVGAVYKNAAGWFAGVAIHIASFMMEFMQLGLFSFLAPLFLAMPGSVAELYGIPGIPGAGLVLLVWVLVFWRAAMRQRNMLER